MSGEDLKGCTPGWCACGHCDPGPVTAPVHPGGERWIVDGGDGCTTEFDTEAEAVAYADACIQDWCDEGWMEEVDNIFVARLTHRSQRQVVAVQGEVSDEEWERVTHGGSGYSEWWDYTIEPVGSTPQAPTVDSVPDERPGQNQCFRALAVEALIREWLAEDQSACRYGGVEYDAECPWHMGEVDWPELAERIASRLDRATTAPTVDSVPVPRADEA